MDLFLNIIFLISPNFYRIFSTIPLLVPCQQRHTLTMVGEDVADDFKIIQVHDLNQSLNFLFAHHPSPVLQLQMDSAVAVVFVFVPNEENFIFQGLVFVFFGPLFLPVHKGGFGKVDSSEYLG